MKPTPSYQHKKSSRVLIPSHEEAGEESQSPAVSGAPGAVEIPKNPVVTRGKDPELFWLGKYGADDSEDTLRVDIRSLYRHEHIVPENIISGLYRMVDRVPGSIGEETYVQQDLFSVTEAFGSGVTQDDLEKPSSYYTHADGWSNRLIQGDSLLGMSSLLHREGMAGKKSSASTSILPTASNTAPTGRSNSTTAPSPTARTKPSPASQNRSKPSGTPGNSASTPTSAISGTDSSSPVICSPIPAPASSRFPMKMSTSSAV